MRLFSLLIIQFIAFLSRNVMLFTIGQTRESDLSAEVDAFYDKTLIQPLRSAWIYGKYGQKRPVKDNDVIRFNSYPLLSTIPTALVQGVNPEPQRLSNSVTTATASLYGGYIELTEECDIYRIDPVVAIAQERASIQAVETVDEITRDIIMAGTNVFYAGAVSARTSIVTKITAADLRKLARAMMALNTPFYKPKVTPTPGVGSSPINNAWLMFISPQVLYDLESSVTGFVNVTAYASQGGVEDYEGGAFGYFRMLVTTNTPVTGGDSISSAIGSTGLAQTYATGYVDVHKCLAIAPDAFGVVDADGGIKTIRKDKSVIGGPLELYGTVGWKYRGTAKILDDNRMYRYECGVSA